MAETSTLPHRQVLALAVASSMVALPAVVRHVEGAGAIAAAVAWTVASAGVFWAGVGAFASLRDARTPWLVIAWLGAFLELDISLRYRRGWAIAVGLLLLAAAALARRVRIDHSALAALLAVLPLVGDRSSPSFVALAPAYLLLARSSSRLQRVLAVGAALVVTGLYTSAWPRTWLAGWTDGFRSKAWGASLLVAASVVTLLARALRGRDLSRWRPVAASGALYILLTALWTLPLLLRLDSVLPQDAADPMLNTWILWWNAHAVPFTAEYWNAPILHPTAGVLTFSEHLFGLSLLTTPLQWLGLSAVAAYNLAFVLSQPLTAGAAHALGYRLTRRHDAALLAGLVLGFAPYRLGHFAHIQILWCLGIPLCLLGLHGYLETRRKRWLALFAGAWLWQGLTNGYLLLYLSVVVALWLAWFVRPRDARVLLPIGLATSAVFALFAPILYVYATEHARLGLRRVIEEMAENGCALASFLETSPFALLARPGPFPDGGSETWAYPGVAAVGLVLAAWVHLCIRWQDAPGRARWSALSAFGGGIALGALLGRWNVALTVGAMLLGVAVAILASATVRAAIRDRTPLGFYTGATVVLCLLAMGPDVRLTVGGEVLFPGPFALLARLPGFGSLRAPGRFAMVAAVCLSAAVALAFARLLPAASVRTRVWSGVAALVIACEGWPSWLPLAPLPARAPLLEELGSEATLALELPLGDWTSEFAAMYRAMYHRLPIVNGWSGHIAPHYRALERGLLAHDPAMLDALAETGALAVLLHHGADPEGTWVRTLEAMPRARLLRRAGPSSVYLLAHAPPAPAATGQALPIRSLTANDNVEALWAARDGDIVSRWTSTQPQTGHEVVEIRLAAESEVQAVVLKIGPYWNDSPRWLSIETSRDGASWQEVWSGTGDTEVLRAALARPLAIPVTYRVPSHRVGYIRLRQLGHDPVMLWSIAEIEVLGRPSQPEVAGGWQAGHQ